MWRGAVALLFLAHAALFATPPRDNSDGLAALLKTIIESAAHGDREKFTDALELVADSDLSETQLWEQFRAIARTAGGEITAHELRRWPEANAATLEFRFGERAAALASVSWSSASPPRIQSLALTGFLPRERAVNDLIRSQLPENTDFRFGLSFGSHEKGESPSICGVNLDKPRYVASLNKLIVLSAVQEAVKEGKLKWGDGVKVSRHAQSPGGGVLFHWPPGIELSVRALACLSIADSDNTASDLLLELVGRRRAEVVLASLDSNERVDVRNRPYLTHAEVWKLSRAEDQDLGAAYLRLDSGKRLAYLEESVRRYPLNRCGRESSVGRQYPESVGWFLTPRQLTKLADQILSAANWQGNGAELSMLASGAHLNRRQAVPYKYLGAKFGSDLGHRSCIMIVQLPDGEWISMALVVLADERALAQSRLYISAEQLIGLFACDQLRGLS